MQGTCKVRNEIETKRNETERNEIKRNETKSNETKLYFVSFCFDRFRFVSFGFASFCLISFRFVRFRFVSISFRFALYRYPNMYTPRFMYVCRQDSKSLCDICYFSSTRFSKPPRYFRMKNNKSCILISLCQTVKTGFCVGLTSHCVNIYTL